MARLPSKIMTIAEKKAAANGLKTALKTHKESVKAIESDHAAAIKTHAVAIKEANKTLSDANKTLDAATKKHDKLAAAAQKGTDKLNSQIEHLNSVEAVRAPRVVAA